MKIDNFFWFLKKPLDEREHHLYGLAYSRAFTFVMMVLAALFVVTARFDFVVPSHVLFFGTFLLLMASHVVGWFTLKNQDISEEKQPTGKSPIWLLYTLPLIVGLYTVLVVFIFSRITDVIQLTIVGASLMYVLLMAYSFVVAQSQPLYFRLILSILWPMFTLFFVTSKQYSKSKLKASLASIGYNIILGLGFVTMVLLLRLFVFSPFYSGTAYFEPAIKNEQYLVINKMAKKDFEAGDFIVYRADRGYVLAKVIDQKDEMVQVEASTGITIINKAQVSGKIIQ